MNVKEYRDAHPDRRWPETAPRCPICEVLFEDDHDLERPYCDRCDDEPPCPVCWRQDCTQEHSARERIGAERR